jgi:hypothetical protein
MSSRVVQAVKEREANRALSRPPLVFEEPAPKPKKAKPKKEPEPVVETITEADPVEAEVTIGPEPIEAYTG